ncbi:MAG: hypothetical protein HLUCCA13_13055 [Halomonas sp. HL-48]|nr:hypothetical protein [Halomonas sp. HL-48]KPQ23504.1 MAG: hypothetical protein HLUCCA13_13055 [Halomonas sp. HL-48]
MLHAITHGKTRSYQRYLGRRDAAEPRVHEEDELTSLIMGPLAFMPVEAIGAFWTSLVEFQNTECSLPLGPITFAKMSFWPRRNVEPDMLVELRWLSGDVRWILVEFKWRAPLSGRRQLHRQWLEFLSDQERCNAYHIFIAPEVSEGLNALGDEDVWDGRLLLRSWFDILNMCRHLSLPEMNPLLGWARQIEGLLGLLNIAPFRGFSKLTVPSKPCLTGNVFWKGSSGFNDLPDLNHPGLLSTRPVFFQYI